MDKSKYEAVKEKMDDFSVCELFAIAAYNAGTVTLEQACAIAHSSPDVLTRQVKEAAEIAQQLWDIEERVGRLFEPAFPPKTEYKITVNGKEKVVKQQHLSYTDIVGLVRDDPEEFGFEPPIYTVTYSRAGGNKREGCLAPGQTVRIADGTHISAYVTSNA